MASNTSFVFRIVLLVLTNMAVILAFSSPYWIIEIVNYGTGEARHGLWFECGSNKECVTNYRLQYKPEIQSKPWFIAVQGLMSVGLALCLLSLLIATISLCCQRQNCSPSGTIAGLLLTTFLAMCVAVILFGIKASQVLDVKVSFDDSGIDRFGWSYWVAAASAALSLVTSGVYGCASRID